MNRYYARIELCDRVEEEVKGAESKRQQEIERIRRLKRRRSRRAKGKILEEKKERSDGKQSRKPVFSDVGEENGDD